MVWAFFGSICIDFPLTMNSRNATSVWSQWHLSISMRILFLNSKSNSLPTCFLCFSIDPFGAIRTSSIQATTSRPPSSSISIFLLITNSIPRCGLRVRLISLWKVAGPLVSPKGITIYSYSPNFVLKAVYFSSPKAIRTGWKPAVRSIWVIESAPKILRCNSDVICKGFLSLTVCWFKWL